MKTSAKFALASAMALGFSTWTAPAQDTGSGESADNQRPPAHERGMGRGGPPPLPAIVKALDANGDGVIDADEIANAVEALKKLDKNGDGKLTRDEYLGPRPGGGPGAGPLPKEILDKYDLNKDGKLDESERAALQKDIEDGKIQPPGLGHGQRGPGGPGGMGTPPTAKELIQKFDTNQDGKLDETELSALLDDMKQHRPGPHGGHGPGGPPPGDQAPQQ